MQNISGHNESSSPKYGNVADWNEFAAVVYNDDGMVEVERIVKFSSPKFQFSPFHTEMDEQRDDSIHQKTSPFLEQDSVSTRNLLSENKARERVEASFDTKQIQANDEQRMNSTSVGISSSNSKYQQGLPTQITTTESKKKKKAQTMITAIVQSPSISQKKKKKLSPNFDTPQHVTPKRKDKKLSPRSIKELVITNVDEMKKKDSGVIGLHYQNPPKQKKDERVKQPEVGSHVKENQRLVDSQRNNLDTTSLDAVQSSSTEKLHKRKPPSREFPGDRKDVNTTTVDASNKSGSQIQSQSPGLRRHSFPSSGEKLMSPKSKSLSHNFSSDRLSTIGSSGITSGPIERIFVPPKGMATRSLVTASVYNNQATGLWITTINTNQYHHNIKKTQASKYLKAFSFHSEREARESAYAYAPPKLWPTETQTTCFLCDNNFSLFKRSSHCRNCGACVCGSCYVMWNSKMIPETYNNHDENTVKICKSCDSLSRLFRQALLDGNYDDVISIYNTGNVNLRCPFMNVKGAEVLYPIHCAVLGGNLDIIVWLIDVHFCPIKVFRTCNKYGEQGTDEQLISTSKGRNVLDMALDVKNVDILRYLICDKNISLFGIKDTDSLLGAFDAAMKALGPLRDDGCYIDDYESSDDNSTIIVTSVSLVAS